MAELHPINPAAFNVPFQVGEKVAFPDEGHKHAGLYGSVEAIGVDENGDLVFDLALIDPATGTWVPSKKKGEEKIIYRAGMGDIQ